MQRYNCDWCGRQKRGGEVWIVGLAAERLGVTVCRREISIASRWSDALARHPLAVHFCSAGHLRRYIDRLLFAEEEMATAAVASTAPSRNAAASTTASPKQRPAPATRRPRFNRADQLRARGLGVQL